MCLHTSGTRPTDCCRTATPSMSTLLCVRAHPGLARLTAVAHRLRRCQLYNVFAHIRDSPD
eukprot:12430138-Karenia_brevis.AAC.1